MRRFLFMETFSPQGGCLFLSGGYIHVYDNNSQTSSLQPHGQSNQTPWKGTKVCINGQGNLPKMAAMAIKCKKKTTILNEFPLLKGTLG